MEVTFPMPMRRWLSIALCLCWWAAGAAGQEPDLQDLLQEGLRAYSARDYESALEIWQRGLELAKKQGDELFTGSFHGNLGIVYSAQGDYEKAVQHLEAALEIGRQAGDRQGLKNRLNNAGSLYLLMGRYDTALERFGEALEIARNFGDNNFEAAVLSNIGETYLRKGDPAEALENFRQAQAALDREAHPDLHIRILSNIAQAYGQMGNYPQAVNHFRLAIRTAQKGKDSPQKTAALIRDYNRMGAFLVEMGDPAAALAFHQSAAELAESAGDAKSLETSRTLLAKARAAAGDGTKQTLEKVRLEGLRRMLARLRRHGEEAIARQVAARLEKLEAGEPAESARRSTPAAPARLPSPATESTPPGLPAPAIAESGRQSDAGEVPGLRSLADLEKRLEDAADMDEVAARLEEMAAADPRNPTIWYALGKNYEAIAQTSFDWLRTNAPDSAQWLLLQANARLQHEDYEAAEPFLEKALAADPQWRGIHAALAVVYDHTGRRERVLDELAAERALGDPDCERRKAECAFEAGRHGEVLELTRDASGARDHYWRLRAAGELAREAFDRLAALPPSVERHVRDAELARQQGRHQASIEHWKAAIELSGGDPRLRLELAVSYFLAHNFVASRHIVEELLEKYPESQRLNYLHGELLLYLQRPKDAIPYLEKAVARSPEDLYAHAALARGLGQLGRHAEAIPHLERALPLDDDGSLHYQLARAYRETGERQKAAEMLRLYQQIKRAAAQTRPRD